MRMVDLELARCAWDLKRNRSVLSWQHTARLNVDVYKKVVGRTLSSAASTLGCRESRSAARAQ